jgi:hypothetical protein
MHQLCAFLHQPCYEKWFGVVFASNWDVPSNHSRRHRITRDHHIASEHELWRRDLKVKIAWALAVKLLGLILLWLLFFRSGG